MSAAPVSALVTEARGVVPVESPDLMSERTRSLGWSIAAIALFFVWLQLVVLPADGFFSGDQGAKYLQARAFAERGPLQPGIEVLSRDIDPDFRYQEPRVAVQRHADHVRGYGFGHRSTSPNTMSSEPRIADTSASM